MSIVKRRCRLALELRPGTSTSATLPASALLLVQPACSIRYPISTLNPIFSGGGRDADSVRAGPDARRVRREGQGGRAQEDQGRAGVVPGTVRFKGHLLPEQIHLNNNF